VNSCGFLAFLLLWAIILALLLALSVLPIG
jgi:hypothetical protein